MKQDLLRMYGGDNKLMIFYVLLREHLSLFTVVYAGSIRTDSVAID